MRLPSSTSTPDSYRAYQRNISGGDHATTTARYATLARGEVCVSGRVGALGLGRGADGWHRCATGPGRRRRRLDRDLGGSPQPVWDADFFAPVGIPRALRNQTIRQVARVSLGGNQVRVEFSNEYGKRPLVIGAAHVALAGERRGDRRRARTAPLTFGGQPSVTIPPGAPVVSDPVDARPCRRSAASPSASTCPRSRRPRPGTTTAADRLHLGRRATSTAAATFKPAQTVDVAHLPQRDPGRRQARRARGRAVRRFDHRRRRLDARRQPSLARLPGRAAAQRPAPTSRSSTRASPAPASCATGWATTRWPASTATC